MSENGTGNIAARLLGRKVGMTRVYNETGTIVPVTVVQAGPCIVTQVKTDDGKDGYNAIQLGFEEIKERRQSKPVVGHCRKTGQTGPKRFFREIRLTGKPEVTAGATIDVGIFELIKYVDVTGISKGKGMQGVMKRWNFGGQPGSAMVQNVSIVRRAASAAAREPAVTAVRLNLARRWRGIWATSG